MIIFLFVVMLLQLYFGVTSLIERNEDAAINRLFSRKLNAKVRTENKTREDKINVLALSKFMGICFFVCAAFVAVAILLVSMQMTLAGVIMVLIIAVLEICRNWYIKEFVVFGSHFRTPPASAGKN